VEWTRVRPGYEAAVHVHENWAGGLRQHFATIETLTAWYGEDFNYFSRDALHYLLPGYMMYVLTKPAATDFGGFDGTVEYLYRQTFDERWTNCPEFTLSQRSAISQWARFIREHLHEYDVDDDDLEDLGELFGPSYAEKLRVTEEHFGDRV
jgi:hypothetical protein